MLNHGIQSILIIIKNKGAIKLVFNYNNKEMIDELYIHDSVYEGFQYDYDERQVTLVCKNYYLNKTYNFKFLNVIFCKLQSCCFWGCNGFYIHHMELKDDADDLENLMSIKDTKPDWYEHSALDKGIKYICVEFLINSGDTLLIICESIDLTEIEFEDYK